MAYNSALDMAEWKDSQPQIIELFGKRLKIANGNSTVKDCMNCALSLECYNKKTFFFCQSADKNLNRYFVEVDEDGNETIK